jgi:hypothetical protein
MKTKSVTLDRNHAATSMKDDDTTHLQDAIYFRKNRLRSDTIFHKKMIVITLISCAALVLCLLIF